VTPKHFKSLGKTLHDLPDLEQLRDAGLPCRPEMANNVDTSLSVGMNNDVQVGYRQNSQRAWSSQGVDSRASACTSASRGRSVVPPSPSQIGAKQLTHLWLCAGLPTWRLRSRGTSSTCLASAAMWSIRAPPPAAPRNSLCVRRQDCYPHGRLCRERAWRCRYHRNPVPAHSSAVWRGAGWPVPGQDFSDSGAIRCAA